MRRWIFAFLSLLFSFSTLGEEAKPAPEPPIDVMEIPLDGFITDEMYGSVVGLVTVSQMRGAKSIHVTINSPGGSIAAGFNIIAALREAKVPIVCEVTNEAKSMAAVILESKACQKRVVHPYSLIMFHEAGSAVMQVMRVPEAERLAAVLRAHSRAMAAIVAPRLGLSIDDYEARVLNREWWLAGVDAVKQGVADEVRE